MIGSCKATSGLQSAQWYPIRVDSVYKGGVLKSSRSEHQVEGH